MQAGPLTKILDLILAASDDLLLYAGLAAVVVVAFVLLRKILRRRRRELLPPAPDLAIDVAALGTAGPPAAGPILEHYNVPVRLAAVVVAPTGRIPELPPEQLPALIDHVVPGLAKVVAAHRPTICYWPPQLSAEGFAHAFFAQAKLPGDVGKGTPWCSAAGRFKVRRKSLMVALVMRAESANNFGQSIIKKEHEWLGILRIRTTA